jgi:WD40 repeat protein
MCWDLESGSSSWGVAAAHQGHITALAWSAAAAAAAAGAAAHGQGHDSSSSSCVISGGQDGVVRVWDGRSGRCIAERAVHVDKKGKGAVGNITTGGRSSNNSWKSGRRCAVVQLVLTSNSPASGWSHCQCLFPACSACPCSKGSTCQATTRNTVTTNLLPRLPYVAAALQAAAAAAT